MHDVGLQWRQ